MQSGKSRTLLQRIAEQLTAGTLAALAVFFCLWFLALNPALPGIFRNLTLPWEWGTGDFDWPALWVGIAGAALCCVFGGFLLESFEVYLPRSAAAALAFIFGLGMVGFVLECLAIPYWLDRRPMAIGLGIMLAGLALLAWRGTRRETESGLGGERGAAEQRMRRALARDAHARSIEAPKNLAERIYRSLCVLLIAAITIAIFWHALLYTDVYWDSLILYLGYARQTFLQHGFPVKVTGQVGIGLGANYPHLYAVLGAGASTALGRWSELPQRLWAPLCGLASTVLVYHSALRLTRNVNAALAVALLYRATPIGIAYDQYASDYALAMLFAAAFLYLVLRAIESGLRGYLILSALLVALSMHLNYLMGIMWLPWAIALFFARTENHAVRREDEPPIATDPGAPWTALPRRPGFGAALVSGWLWTALLACAVIGSTWHIRNWIVTGNPVYAFFYKSLGGKNINPIVMEAAAREWMVNGAGIGGFAQQIVDLGNQARQSQPGMNLPGILFPSQDNLLARVQLLPEYFLGSPIWHQGFQLEPLFGAFFIGGFLAWFGRWLLAPFLAPSRDASRHVHVQFGFLVAILAVGLIAFHVVLAPFYLYQIIKILPCLALMAALAWPVWNARPWRWVFGGLALWTGLVPGLAMALMGFKVASSVKAEDAIQPLTSLYILRHPMPEPRDMYRWRYGDDPLMWAYININLHGEKLLTHENRDLVFDPSITLVNLDDWNIQPLWQDPDPANRVLRLVRDFNIHYYLYIPNEEAASTNALMGAKEWEKQGLAKLVFQTTDPPDRLYRLTPRTVDAATSAAQPAR